MRIALLDAERAKQHKGECIVTLADARKVIAAAEKKAQDIQWPMNIAVVDEGGNLVSHIRMDGAWIGSVDISISKEYTSRAFDISTKELAGNSQPAISSSGYMFPTEAAS